MEEYIVSARKYRPMTFGSVVGQQALTTTLKNAVRSQKLAHAYLFCGPRGVGKTTCARIFAKAINCQNPTQDGEACGQCESCMSFNEQRSLNIFELDAASNNSVEHIKTLMEQTRIPPQLGRYKVFIIDEVHMLSTAAFNAFLKTLEEPPAHVIFILATTEKHKILPTILSRCQIYDFERMSVQDTIAHLKQVAASEGISYEEQALAVIAEKADGGMRDALSIFDQCASFCQGNITYQKVIEDLNVLDADYYFRMVDLSLQNKVSDVMVLLDDILSKGFDGLHLIGGLAKHVRNVMMARDAQTLPLLETSDEMRQRYQEQAARCNNRFLYGALKLLNQCDINYRQSGNKRLLVELTLIQVAQLTQPDDADTNANGPRPRRLKILFKLLVAQPQAPQVADKGSSTPATAAPATAAPAATPATAPSAERPNNSAPHLRLGQLGHSWSQLKQMAEAPKASAVAATPLTNSQQQSPAADEAVQATDTAFTQEELQRQWLSMCNRMPQRLSGIAARMKNMLPQITQLPQVTVEVANEQVRAEMEHIKGSIAATLRRDLNHKGITLTITLAAQQQQERILTRVEQYELMSKDNPAVEQLRQLFDLELA